MVCVINAHTVHTICPQLQIPLVNYADVFPHLNRRVIT